MTHWKRRMAVGVLTGVVLTGGVAWRAVPRANQPIETARPSQEDTAVRRLPASAQTPPGRKGSTYYSLEARTTKVTSKFDDGTVAIGERGTDGALHVKITDASGSELARLDVADSIRFGRVSGEPFHADLHPDVRPTLEWANRQAYGLLREGTLNLVWRGELMRGGTSNLAPRDVEAEWEGGLGVKTTRRDNVKDASADGRVFTGTALSTRLTRAGVEVGRADYYPRSQVFRWTIPALRVAGSVEAKHLERYKGWPFTPDHEWLNLQMLAFHHFKTLIEQKGFVAANVKGCGAPPASLAKRMWEKVVPRVSAEEGCDGLHWLDGSIFRYCCDVHDNCYEKYGCNASSWWRVWSSWRCDYCNTWAIWCFGTGGCLFTGGLSCT